MQALLRVSVVVIGDEILGGYVQDTNSGWLAQRLRSLGVPLDRIVTVPDDDAAIGEALGTELARQRPRVVLTSGGIGSTPDDVTYDAVAARLGVGLRVEPEIAARIDALLAETRQQGITVSEEHERALHKMALVPEGGYLLRRGSGLAPGVAVDVDGGVRTGHGATVVILPGIPGELQRIVRESVEPELLAGRGVAPHVEELRHGYPESALTPAFERVVLEFPDVHLGSYPGPECIVRLSGRPERVAAARTVVETELARLAALPGAAELRRRWAARWP